MIYYKIRSKKFPDQWVKGTPYYLSYDSRGRVFQTLGSLRAFITGVLNYDRSASHISDWDIIEFEMTIKEVKGVHDIITPKKLIELLSR